MLSYFQQRNIFVTHTKKQQELIEELASICEELGWVIALPTMEDTIPGLVIGQETFVNDVVSVYYGSDYEVFTKEKMDEGLKEVPILPPTKKPGTYH